MIGLQNRINESAEIFDVTRKKNQKQKNSIVCVSFLSGIYLLFIQVI